ncbi:MAG: hypothetical protein HKN29_15720, partial [Rhodothermales bacterium]|nr:hypothetical protein [Rhodothermales bacterium]
MRSVLHLEARVLEWDPALETIPAFNRLLVTGSPMDWEPGRVQEAFERLLTSVLGEHDPDVQH